MGNQSCSFPRILTKDFDLPDLKNRSSYGENHDLPNEQIVRAVYAQSYNDNRKTMVAKQIQDNKLFVDDKFKVDSKESSRLSVLFDFERMKTRIYSKKGDLDITSFIQLNIQFCYLTSVFYLLCRKETRTNFIKNIIETQQCNKYGAYSLYFFCNGERHPIIIDDQMPTNSDSFIYLRIVKGIQLWPLILEKAWCKQVGSYERAKGLSPEDAFEEITGIPAYTYKFRSDNKDFIKGILHQSGRLNYWVSLIARNGLEDLKNRQVFYLQEIDSNDNYVIISPFSSYNFGSYQHQRRGEVKVRYEDIFDHFQYAVIGYYKQGYSLTSLPVDCKTHEQIIFELNVKNSQDVSIRFNQFYEGYLEQQERLNYQYSPILIELYQLRQNPGAKGQKSLVYQCQGCNRSLSGARSIHCAKGIFNNLQGRYFIRLEVDWQHQSLLHKGNLVVYSSEGNTTLKRLPSNKQTINEIYQQFFDRKIPKQNITVLNQHNIQVRTYNKLNTTLLQFKNLINSTQKFEINFQKSTNILIRGGEVKGNKTVIKIEGQESIIIQILPNQLRKGMNLQDFQVVKIEKNI